MKYQVAIYSGDAVFARMLELDFFMRGTPVLRAEQPMKDVFSEVAILDLDTCTMPPTDTYRRLIGFTCNSRLLTDEVRRQCSLILHRPFEMRLLREEVFQADMYAERVQPMEPTRSKRRPLPHIQLEGTRLAVDSYTVELTSKEAQVMELLLERRGEAVPREEISKRIGESASNKADVYVCYLRRKLDEPLGIKLIHTVRGLGYCLN